VSWKNSPEGQEKYRKARAEAQKAANADGYDRGLEANDYAKDFFVKSLPAAQYRFGHELRIEIVSCESLDRTAPDHGHKAHSDAVRRAT
jgi:hypothetical protein